MEFPSISQVAVGYSNGHVKEPTYKQVCNGDTGHAEALRFEYDPQKVNYADLVKFFFRMHDPTTLNRQGNDVGTQYRSAIFYYSEEQRLIAEQVKAELQQPPNGPYKPPQSIVTEISPAKDFWYAEDYHQQYLLKNPGGYCNHRLRF